MRTNTLNVIYEGWESKPKKKRKKVLIIGLILGMLLLLLLGNLNYNQRIGKGDTTGRAVEDIEVSEQEIQIAEQKYLMALLIMQIDTYLMLFILRRSLCI